MWMVFIWMVPLETILKNGQGTKSGQIIFWAFSLKYKWSQQKKRWKSWLQYV
jgi:hypothetical protein